MLKFSDLTIKSVMVSVMCQFVWVIMPNIWSDIILCVGVFSMRLTFKSVSFEYSILLSIMWVGLIQSIDGFNRTKLTFPEQERIPPTDGLHI